MLKVGIDARSLSRPITGIGRYTLEICRVLSKLPNISLYLYSPAPIPFSVLKGWQVEKIYFQNLNNGFLRQIWSETLLPFWVKKDDIDVFWGPAHRIPHWLPRHVARVVTIHDLVWKYVSETMRPFSLLLERYQMPFAVSKSDAVVASSIATAEAVKKEFGISLEKLSVVTLAPTLTEGLFNADLLGAVDVDQPYFLFVGTLKPRKNLSRLLKAYSLLSNSIKDQAILVIAGGKGWGDITVTEEVTSLNLSNYVKILGYVDEITLSALYSNSKFLAMPSLYEGFGLPLVEAMSYGVPVLTANNSSMTEVAGNAGILVDALDIKSIADGLKEMITNNKLRKTLAKNAKLNSSRYSWDESAIKLIKVFEKAIKFRKNKIS